MSRYIDADAMKEWIDEYVSVFKKSDNKDIKGYIEHQPTIDIVRCKECKYFIDNLTEDDTDEAYDSCRWDWSRKIPTADDFCSYGVKEGADDDSKRL